MYDRRLTSPARDAMANPDVELFFSAASIWEMAIKRAAGKLELPQDFLFTLGDRGFTELAISARHGEVAAALPPHHRDPFDRMIVAQAQSEHLTVITDDRESPPTMYRCCGKCVPATPSGTAPTTRASQPYDLPVLS